ncbi:hypothetical protein [Brevibacillus migulae]|uniref:hypothetical protein n=1 Tax=Brevibacillus migulae TaxID=1644114 RepID=UPI00106DEA30|nr:hypothetical protein [Brevibacillus migulae]
MNAKSQVTTSITSVLLAFLASSHHWLHMGLLFLLGSQTSVMATMSSMIWVRRLMIIATAITIGVSLYRMLRHKRCSKIMKVVTILSAILSAGFIVYTLAAFGW